MTDKEELIRDKLRLDPGNPVFAEFAEFLRRKKRLDEALEVCLTGLNSAPSFELGRLVLARVLYSKGLTWLAVRELEQLYSISGDNPLLLRLIQLLNPSFAPQIDAPKNLGDAETMIAETSFDFGQLDLLDET